MGYSATTPIKSWKTHARLLAFLQENLRPWHQLMPDDLGCRTPEADWTQRLTDSFAYDKGTCRLGFNFSSSSGLMGEYGSSILRWMAVVAGRKRRLHGFDVAVPYHTYDGKLIITPVLVRSVWEGRVPEDVTYELVDEDGWMPACRTWRPELDREDGLVERSITTDAPADVVMTLLDEVRKRGGENKFFPESLTKTVIDGDSCRIEGSNWFTLVQIDQSLREAGYATEVTFGTPIPTPEEKMLEDKYGARYDRADEIIKSELSRLSRLWDAYQETP